MIQRIQSLYLLGAAVLSALVCFLPLSSFIDGGEVFKLYAWGVKNVATSEFIVRTPYMGILIVLAALLPFATIFLYRRRWVQIRLCIVEVVLQIGVLAYFIMYIAKAFSVAQAGGYETIALSVVDIFPLLSMLLVYLAFRGIAKDEALVRSLDRIR